MVAASDGGGSWKKAAFEGVTRLFLTVQHLDYWPDPTSITEILYYRVLCYHRVTDPTSPTN